MFDYMALQKAHEMPDHATPPARMIVGDDPKWNADMDSYNMRSIYDNPTFKSPHILKGIVESDQTILLA